MKFSDFKRKVLMVMGEWSANGALITELSNKDYLLAITDITNDKIEQYVTTAKCKYKDYKITQKNPINGLGQKWREYELENGEEIFTLDRGKMYSLEVAGTCTITIDELIGAVWTNLVTINHTQVVGEGYTLYNGNVTKTDNSNTLRIRITSNFDIPYRWVALWTENLETVPKFQPFIEYTLPTDVYQVERVNLMDEFGEYHEYPDRLYTRVGKELSLRYEEDGEFNVTYFAYPTELTYDADNINVADDEELDLPDEYIPGLIHDVAGELKANIDRRYGVGDRLSGIGIDSVNSAIIDQQKKSIERPMKGSRRAYDYPKTKNCYKYSI